MRRRLRRCAFAGGHQHLVYIPFLGARKLLAVKERKSVLSVCCDRVPPDVFTVEQAFDMRLCGDDPRNAEHVALVKTPGMSVIEFLVQAQPRSMHFHFFAQRSHSETQPRAIRFMPRRRRRSHTLHNLHTLLALLLRSTNTGNVGGK